MGRRGRSAMTTDKINLVSKLAQFQDHWKPRTVAHLNEYDIMVVKVQGEFVWHKRQGKNSERSDR